MARRLWAASSHHNLAAAAAAAAADAYDDDPDTGRPRTNFHSSFHDLHLANEARASRHDLREMREEVLRGFRGPASSAHVHPPTTTAAGGAATSRRSFRKWPLPPAKGSPSCRRCSEFDGDFGGRY